jgi:ABC-2 type transport system ATP-binding protein
MGADVAIPTGCLSALVGPNGAGKTTLMRAWLGFERPSRGRVMVLGHDPVGQRGAVIAACAHVSQEVALYRSLSAREHFAYAKVLRPSFDVRAALAVLERADVRPDAPARALSGGQRLQLALALAVGARAPVLLLDEPLANLDPLARRDVVVQLAGYAGAVGACVLVSTHLVSDLEGGFGHVVVMSEGRVVEAGMIGPVVPRYAVLPSDAEAPSAPWR